MFLLVSFCFTCCLIAFWYKGYKSTNRVKGKWLNGPRALPLFGGGIQIAWIAATRTLNQTVTELCSRYGRICGVYGSRNNYFVFVNAAEVAERILKDVNFEGKFPQSSWDSLMYGKPNLGILHAFGSTATELRSRSISKLRKFGYGNSKFLSLIETASKRILYKWECQRVSNNGILLIEKYSFSYEISNLLWNILSGAPFPGDESDFKSFVDAADVALNQKVKQFVILYAYKFLRFIPHVTMYQWTKNWFKDTEILIKNLIAQRKANGKYQTVQNNLLDSFLLDIDAKLHPVLSEEQLVWVINDLQLVGVTGLAANSLRWTLLYICLNQEVMEKLEKEIENVVGYSESLTLEHRSRMPYAESIILESIRMGNVVNYAMRTNLHDVNFEGYFIPKETLVMVDTECMRKDPLTWVDPNIFRPERFYCAETQKLVNVEKLNAFGHKRPCLGENIVKQANFFLMVSLFQKYEINLCPNYPPPSTQSRSGIIGQPEPYYISITPRVVGIKERLENK